jgi:hypothetical protein
MGAGKRTQFHKDTQRPGNGGALMSELNGFEIYYHFNGESRHFFHQALHLCDSEAVHIATLHAGVVSTRENMTTGPVRLAIQNAEGVGVTDVHWKKAH